jgi:hypothetical protein
MVPTMFKVMRKPLLHECSRWISVGLVVMSAAIATPSLARHHCNDDLRFNNDGTFTIVQFTDIQDDEDIDPRTVLLIEAVLDDQSPDLVVFTGDNIRSGCDTPDEVQMAINNFAEPVDSRHIPWFITYGNHDEDSMPNSGLDENDMLKIYMSYRYNINKPGPRGVDGTGNMYTLIKSAHGHRPVYNIWGLDSGRYAPQEIDGQLLADDTRFPEWENKLPGWDWIKPSQIKWYMSTSEYLEHTWQQKIPSLMFFHIPLWEFVYMWENSDAHDVIGEKNESVCPGPFNSGLFTAMLQRGDVKGVFVGHDHVNNFVGNYFGITLGYSANAGFGTYGLDGAERDRLRGARVFVLRESDLNTFETYMVYALDYGIQ